MSELTAFDTRNNIKEISLIWPTGIELNASEYSAITEIELITNGTTYSSLTDSDIWVDNAVKVRFGMLTAAKGSHIFRVVMYDTSNANGITFEDNLRVFIK